MTTDLCFFLTCRDQWPDAAVQSLRRRGFGLPLWRPCMRGLQGEESWALKTLAHSLTCGIGAPAVTLGSELNWVTASRLRRFSRDSGKLVHPPHIYISCPSDFMSLCGLVNRGEQTHPSVTPTHTQELVCLFANAQMRICHYNF